MARNYLNVDDSASFKDGYFYPGDMGYFTPEKELFLVGRSSNLHNIGGVKMDLEQIDEELTAISELIDHASFVSEGANGILQLEVAIVIDSTVDKIGILEKIKKQLGERAPTRVVQVDGIPRTSSGKASRAELADQIK